MNNQAVIKDMNFHSEWKTIKDMENIDWNKVVLDGMADILFFKTAMFKMMDYFGYSLVKKSDFEWSVMHLDHNRAGIRKSFDSLEDAITYIFEDMGGTRCRTRE